MPSSTTLSESRQEPAREEIRVLLVDDNQAMLARAAAVLAPSCAVVGQVRDGAAVLTAAAAIRPDVIVLDVSMLEVSGLDVARSLHRTGSRAAIVFLSVHDDTELAEAALAAGACGYVIKARLASDLLRAVLEARAHRTFISKLS